MNQVQQIDRDKNTPTLTSELGAAWEINLCALRAKKGLKEDADACVCLWIVYAPYAHPFWHYYMLGAVHLRNVPGMKPPKILLPGASHEVLLYALDPQKIPNLDDPVSTILVPPNFVWQWDVYARLNPVDQDKKAVETIHRCVVDILQGALNPDTDARHQWIKRFSDSNYR